MDEDKRYAIVDSDHNVINVIRWNGIDPWEPDPVTQVVECPEYVGKGWRYEGGEFIASLE